jgi:hypothetical protein
MQRFSDQDIRTNKKVARIRRGRKRLSSKVKRLQFRRSAHPVDGTSVLTTMVADLQRLTQTDDYTPCVTSLNQECPRSIHCSHCPKGFAMQPQGSLPRPRCTLRLCHEENVLSAQLSVLIGLCALFYFLLAMVRFLMNVPSQVKFVGQAATA